METKESTVKPTIMNVKGSELPAELARRAGVSPDQSVWITVTTGDLSPKQQLLANIREAQAQAYAAGLTSEEQVNALLHDDE